MLVGVRSVGVCGTDVSIFHGSIPVDYPRVLGHEIVGQVLDGETPFPHGARVIVDPNIACGACDRCAEGRENICGTARLLGRDRDGGLQERLVVPASNLYAVPRAVPDHVAPAIQMLATCLHGQRLAAIRRGESVAVVGLGVTGLMHVQLAAMYGAAPIVGVSRSPEKLAMGTAMGAAVVAAADEPDLEHRVREATGGGADLVIESAGAVATLGVAVRLARPGGRVLAYGTITESEGSFPFYDLYYKELDVISPRAATAPDMVAASAVVAAGSVDLEPLVTDRVPLEGIGDVLAGSRRSLLKTVVEV